MKKRVYIAGPITKGDLLHNIQQADHAFKQLVDAGFAPFNPMLTVYAGAAERSRKFVGPGEPPVFPFASRGSALDIPHDGWLDIDYSWIAVADAVLRLPGLSVGAEAECIFALERGIPVAYSVQALIDHFKTTPQSQAPKLWKPYEPSSN